MLFGIFFASWRFLEILTLIPMMGMLAYFVHIYNSQNLLTPQPLLILFILSVLALAWAIATLFTYHRSRQNSMFVAFIDLCFVGAFIAAVYLLRDIGHANCVNWHSSGSTHDATLDGWFNVSVTGVGVTVAKNCAMIKASWVFAIMNIIFFAITAVVAALFGRDGSRTKKETYVRETRYRSSGGHSRRSGSHRSHRSSHSGRHAYV